ncbi:MAG: oligosaccharide flippase family protein [Eubacterium sp.]
MKFISNLKNKYLSMSVGVKAALWFTICNFLQKCIAMITMPIFTRLLTTEQYGVFTLYQSWYSIVSIIVTLNIAGSVVNNGMVKYETRRNEFISAMQGLSFTVTMFFFVIYLFSMDFWNKIFDLSSIFVLTMFVQLLFEPAYLLWSQRQRYEYKYKSLVAVTITVSAMSPILGVIAVISTDYKAEARVISFALVQVCAGLIFFIIQTIRGKKLFVKDFWKFALSFNLPLIPHYLSQFVLGQADRIMIGKMIGKSEAAIYGVTYNLASVLTLFVNAINSSFVPYLYENLKKKEYKGIRKTATTLCLFMAVIICLFMLLGPEAIMLFSTSEYSKAKWVFPPVAASVFFTFVYTLYINIEFYFEKTKYVMFVSIIGAVLNIGLNYIFINKFGFIAAGYTTVFCYILFALGHFFLCKLLSKKRNIKENIFDSKKIFALSVLVIIFMLVSVLLYKFNIVRYVLLGIAVIISLINYKKIIQFVKNILAKQ